MANHLQSITLHVKLRIQVKLQMLNNNFKCHHISSYLASISIITIIEVFTGTKVIIIAI